MLCDQSIQALWEALPEDHPRTAHKISDIDGFNDYPCTHHVDVLWLIQRAIESNCDCSA